jgi:hypothetical protein
MREPVAQDTREVAPFSKGLMVAVIIQVAGPRSFDAIQAESSRGVPLPPVEVSTLMRSSGDIKRRISVICLDTL